MSFTDSLFGRPLATSEERAEHIGVAAGIPIFGLDALTSAAYGPETALALLIPLGLMGIQYIVPIISAILILLVIVYFSYRQTIAAYPGGGGSYTVATENLGTGPGLLAAAALMIDYILTAAVGISAGIENVVSAQQWLLPHTLMLCLVVLACTRHGEHAWGQGHRRGVHRSHLPLRRHTAGDHRLRRMACLHQRRPSDADGAGCRTRFAADHQAD